MTKFQIRQQAEEILRNRSEDSTSLSLLDTQHLLHELQVHQIELEMQNDELRKKNEEYLTLHKKYVELYDFAPSGYCTLDQKGQILKANLTFAKQLGVERNYLINTLFYHYLVKEERDLLYLHLKKLFQTEVQTNCEIRLVKQNGCQFHAHLESIIVRNSVDNISVIYTSIMDITEQKQTEQALQASEAKYRSLVDNLNVGIFRSSVAGKILSVNRALVRMLGFDSAEELMQLPAILRYATHREELLAKLREQGEVKKFEVEVLRKDGSAFFASMSSILKYDEEGNPLFMDGVIEDITKRRQIEAELAEERATLAKKVEKRTAELSQANAELARAARLKNEFFANMSHELRTPLNTILSMSELLSDGIYGEVNAEQLKAAVYIEDGGHHLLSLITDILDLSKIEAGKMELHPENIIIENVCHASMQMVKQIAMKKQVSVLFASNGDVKTIFADERAIKQILVNLLNNAVKFTPRKGKVALELQGDKINRMANINVIDTGIGIEEHELDKLFKPFVQIDSSLNRQHEGTGLGLALVYKLAKLHGGSVQVKSKIGKGSTFTVSLPWQDNEKIPSRSDNDYVTIKKDIKVRNKGAIVLMAEDNEANIVSVQSGLKAYGYNVIVTRDGIEAIERAKEIKPAIILMDIQMPGMDGLEAIKQIRADEQLAKIPIIALTALAMPGDQKCCLDAGANVYLSKPANIKRLVGEIETLLA